MRQILKTLSKEKAKEIVGIVGIDTAYNILMQEMEARPKVQGLSMPQFGQLQAAFMCRRKGKLIFMANPKIIFKFGSRRSLEGCESVKGYWYVKRPLFTVVEYTNEKHEVVRKFCTWKLSRIVNHEYDHLQGITIKDHGKYWYGNSHLEAKYGKR